MISVPAQVEVASPPAPSKKKKARKKSTDLKISTDLKQNLDAKTESKCVKFWKTFCCVESWKKRCPCVRTKKQRTTQAKRGVALFCLCMYCFDVGSDLSVGFDLLNRCHEITGYTVLAFVWIPGVFYSLMTFLEADFDDKKTGKIDVFTCCQKSITCFFMIFFTGIMTFGFLLAEVFNPNLNRDTKKLKFFEVFYEAYPQLLINLMLMMRLNMYGQTLYVGSCVASFCSLLYGTSDAIAFKKFEDEGGMTKVILCMLSLFIDCLFRSVLISFLLASWTFDEKDSMQKLWIFMAGFLYIFVIMVYLKVHASNKKVDAPMSAVFKGAMSSLVASAWLDKDLKYTLRFVSKSVFGFLATIALVLRTVEWFNYKESALEMCQNICIPGLTGKNPKNPNFNADNVEDCDNQELALGKSYQLGIIIGLWSLLLLSLLEGLLEKFTDIPMPFRILQEEKEELPEPVWNNRGTVQNQIYGKNDQKKETVPQISELSELPRQLEEPEVDQTVVPIALPSL